MDINLERNDNLKILANKVLDKYDFQPQEISIVQSGSIKTVWKFKDRKGVFCLKRLKQTMDKALFSVNAQMYIKNSGGNVPEISLNKQGEPITIVQDQLFVVYEWLLGRDLNFNNSNDLAQALGGLAKFHLASKGYKAIEGARISTKLGKWPNQYTSMKEKLIAWKEVARGNTNPEHQAYLKNVDQIVETAESALMLLEKSAYNSLISKDSDRPVLCHQDFGKGNAILTDKGIVVLDLDGVTYDLPARDLRKIIGKMAENSGKWNVSQITAIIGWYTEINPFSVDEQKVLYIDLLFPHWFFGLVKNQYDIGKILKPSEIERITRLELSKVPIIKELLAR